MHEMGLADAVLKMVDGIVSKEDVRGVNSITLEIGELSGVVPRFMSDCWQAVADGTKFETTELKIISLPGTARCEDCKAVFTANVDDLRCPKCRGAKLTPLSGMEMTIKEIEAF